jgi:hypothetical protein
MLGCLSEILVFTLTKQQDATIQINIQTYVIYIRNAHQKGSLGTLWRRWKDTIKMGIKEVYFI